MNQIILTALCAIGLLLNGCTKGLIDDVIESRQAAIDSIDVAGQVNTDNESVPDEGHTTPTETLDGLGSDREAASAALEDTDDLEEKEILDEDDDSAHPHLDNDEHDGDDNFGGHRSDGAADRAEAFSDGPQGDEPQSDHADPDSEGHPVAEPDGREEEDETEGTPDDPTASEDDDRESGIEFLEGLAIEGRVPDESADDGDDGEFERESDDELTENTEVGNGLTYGVPGAPIRIQAIGDSHLAFNERQSTPAQLSSILAARGKPNVVQNNAIGGATLGCGQNGIGDAENCIPPQFVSGNWTHILISAGANDYLEATGDCDLDLDVIIQPDFGGGGMVDLVHRLRGTGADIIIVGYVELLDPNSWARCAPRDAMMRRYRDFAAQTPGVTFIDTRDAFTRDQPANYADDIHTSVEGSRRLAEHIARTVAF
ncbi:MAG: GDSL-type esterase/lipase family protein [Myxococcota bacterium]|nr:GDSL-type esterase/lipase family protein [Myxococcota bacterium]